VHEEVASDEDENKLPYQSPKWIPPKSHVNTTTNPTKGNYVYKTVTKYTSFFNFPIVFMLSSLWATICILLSIVFKPGLVQDQGSEFWPGQFFFLKSKRCRFSKTNKTKTKINGLQPGLDQVLSGQLGRRVIPGFFFSYFFFNPVRFKLEVSRIWIDPLNFKTMLLSIG